jgi:hypothetical protein
MPISTIGTTIITWTYDDGFGNTTTQTQDVTISDNTAPVPDSSSLTDLTGFCYVEAPAVLPTATDNCTGVVSGTTTTQFPITSLGTTIVTWEYDDGNGNVATQTQNIIVDGVDVTTSVSGFIITSNDIDSLTTYQWIDCGNNNDTISGENNASFTATQNGSYAVIVADANCIDTSECVQFLIIGINDLTNESLVVYPNPSLDGIIMIEFDGIITEVAVWDIFGRLMTVQTSNDNKRIDVSLLDNGKYFVRIVSESKNLVKEINVLE